MAWASATEMRCAGGSSWTVRQPARTTSAAAIAHPKCKVALLSDGILLRGALAMSVPVTLVLELRDDPEGLSTGLHPLDVVEAVPEARRPVLPRRPGGVRGERDGGETEQRVILGGRLVHQDVQPGAADPLVLQRLVQRELVDDGPATGVDQDGAGLHQRQLPR